MDAWASKSSIQLIQSYCHTKLVALSEGRHFPDLWSLNAAEMGTFEEQSWVCEDQATQSFAHSCMDSEAPAQYIPAAGDNDTQE